MGKSTGTFVFSAFKLFCIALRTRSKTDAFYLSETIENIGIPALFLVCS